MSRDFKIVALVLQVFLLLSVAVSAGDVYVDAPFMQEYHVPYLIAGDAVANDVRTVFVDADDNVWAGTGAGVFLLLDGETDWLALTRKGDAGPVYSIRADDDGRVWVAAWNGVFRASQKKIVRVGDLDAPIVALYLSDEPLAFGPGGQWRLQNGAWRPEKMPFSKNIRTLVPDPKGGYWLATGMGLYRVADNGWRLFQDRDELLTPDLSGLAFAPDGSLWVGCLGGISVIRHNLQIKQYTPQDGLPSSEVHCIEQGPDGVMWVGTSQGVVRFDGRKRSLRNSRRWLLDDHVRDVAFDSDGTAWIATAKGVSAIKRKQMTLAQKDAHFHNVCLTRHQREPGIVEKCRLTVPGDTTSWEPQDDDNDGQYTSMYLAMESYRFATTKSPRVRADARKAFDALYFLQKVTETDGFVARTVIPTTWERMFDANRTYTKQEIAERRVVNPREKIVENLWRPSKDGKWLWKGDTSSDEITGHMYGYLFYYDLAADKREKKRVAEHICAIVDYIIDGGYVLRDIDGTHTKWAVWAPEYLNDDPDWRTERGINSVEILSYLKLAWHVSGDARYQKEYEKLLYEHNYIENVKRAKTTNPAWRTHIDDELLALAYPCLLLYEDDPHLRDIYLESFEQWYAEASKDCSPYFNFIYAAFTGQDPNFECSIDFLKHTPLDLVQWRVDNGKREDVRLVRAPAIERWQTDRWLPIDENSFFRWDRNPRDAVRGNGGRTESDGVFWMLPYWMGRYYGFIE